MAEVGQNCPRHDSDALVGVGVHHSAIVFDRFRTMEDIVRHLWEESRRDKDISYRLLYNLRVKESDSDRTHLSEYESQRTTIEDELRAMLLMSSLPFSWETFITTVCNASTTAIKYSKVTSAILTKAVRRKSFAKDFAGEAYVVQGSDDRPNNRGTSSSRPLINQRSWSKSWDNRPATIAWDRDTSNPIVLHSTKNLTKLKERIRRVVGMRRSITLNL